MQRESLQSSYSQRRAAREDRDRHLKEKEDYNRILRKDLLEVVTQFDAEKTNLERRVADNRERNRELEEEMAGKKEEVAR